MPRDVNAFRAGQLLRRSFLVTGDDPGKQLDDVLYTAFEVEQAIRARPEHAWARGERIWARSVSSAALALVNSSVGVRVPAGRGVFTVILGIHCRTPALLDVRINGNQTLPVITDVQALLLDTRFWTRGDPTAVGLAVTHVIAAQGNLPVTSPHWQMDNQVNGAAQYQEYPPVVLAPGSDLYVTNGTINQAITASFWGVEREATSSELGGR